MISSIKALNKVFDISSLGGALMVTQYTLSSSSHSDLVSSSFLSGQSSEQVTNSGESHFSSTSSWVSSRTCADGRTLSYIQNRSPLACK